MLVVTAILALVLIGATALAVDLSANTQSRRSLQNITDSAALAAARNLPSNQNQAMKDALDEVYRNSPWSTDPTWLASAQAAITCTAGTCTVSHAGPGSYSNYTASASSPPASPKNSAYNSSNYIQVDLTQSTTNGFAGAVGFSSSTEVGHSVAYNAGPSQFYDYAFFTKVHAGSGNQQELIYGDAYLGNGYSPQSSGKAGFCAFQLTGSEAAATDTDGDAGLAPDNDVDDQGHLTFGVVPPSVGPDPTYGAGPPCPGSGQLSAQSGPPGASNCPPASSPQSYTRSGTNYSICLQASPPLPNIQTPIPTPTSPSAGSSTSPLCGTTISNGYTQGVFAVGAGCTVTLDFSSGNIDCVSLVLGAGASVSINSKKGSNYISSYGFNPTGDTVAISAITALPAIAPVSACPGASTPEAGADKSVIWAPNSSASPMPTALSNSTTGCCSDTLFLGTVYLPGQAVSFATNQAMEDVGMVYCGDWNVQSGNHPNPMVQFDSASAAPLQTILRLVE
jgi:Flp pilus assembly protein TadG